MSGPVLFKVFLWNHPLIEEEEKKGINLDRKWEEIHFLSRIKVILDKRVSRVVDALKRRSGLKCQWVVVGNSLPQQHIVNRLNDFWFDGLCLEESIKTARVGWACLVDLNNPRVLLEITLTQNATLLGSTHLRVHELVQVAAIQTLSILGCLHVARWTRRTTEIFAQIQKIVILQSCYGHWRQTIR